MFKDRKPLVSESKNLKAKYAKIKAYRNRAKKMAQTFYLVQFSVTQFSSVFNFQLDALQTYRYCWKQYGQKHDFYFFCIYFCPESIPLDVSCFRFLYFLQYKFAYNQQIKDYFSNWVQIQFLKFNEIKIKATHQGSL